MKANIWRNVSTKWRNKAIGVMQYLNGVMKSQYGVIVLAAKAGCRQPIGENIETMTS